MQLQNHFIQVTIQKGRFFDDGGDIKKVIDETLKDDVYPFNDESGVEELKKRLVENVNLDFEAVQQQLNEQP